MKSSIVFLLVVTACGPAFSENFFTGESDAAALENSKGGVSDVRSTPDVQKETLDAASVQDSAGLQDVVGDASAGPVACDCTELCNGNYALRACESCIEVCPTYDGAVPW